jgi:hypothetical protein
MIFTSGLCATGSRRFYKKCLKFKNKIKFVIKKIFKFPTFSSYQLKSYSKNFHKNFIY